MIKEAKRLHPSLLTVTIVFMLGFLTVAVATVISVLGDEMPDPAQVDAIDLPTGVVVVDTHATCTADACDGEGAVVLSKGMSAEGVAAMIEGRLRSLGWVPMANCGVGIHCLWADDLRGTIQPWSSLTEEGATAAMRSNIDDMDIDQARLVYIRLYRCGIVVPCG